VLCQSILHHLCEILKNPISIEDFSFTNLIFHLVMPQHMACWGESVGLASAYEQLQIANAIDWGRE